jgi:hypothetical protein
MLKVFDAVKAQIAAFASQRADVALIIESADESMPFLIKTAEEVDEGSSAEFFWIATDNFTDVDSYVAAVIDGFAAKHEVVRLALLQQGKQTWPEIPARLRDPATPPVERLRGLMEFSRELLPDSDGCTAVWCLMPHEIADARWFAWLLASVLHHEFPFPWFHHLRFIMRADAISPDYRAALADWPRLRWYRPDLSQAAVAESMDDATDDESRPIEERLQLLYMSANADYAHGRIEPALDKLSLLLDHYAKTGNSTMAALTMNTLGEVHRRRGNMEQAGACFEQAFAPLAALESPPVPVILNLCVNLGDLRLAEQNYEAAELYFDSAQQLSTLQRAPLAKLQLMDKLGGCQYSLGKYVEAHATWTAGESVARELELHAQRRIFLVRLRDYYAAARDHARQADAEREIAATDAVMRQSVA